MHFYFDYIRLSWYISVFGAIENSGFEGASRDHPVQLSFESTALDLVIWGPVKPIKSWAVCSEGNSTTSLGNYPDLYFL